MKFALIENNVVKNIIVADQKFIDENRLSAINVDDIYCGIGFIYKDGEFIQPQPELADELETE